MEYATNGRKRNTGNVPAPGVQCVIYATKKMKLCVVTFAHISLNWKKMVPFKKLVIEVDGVRHRLVRDLTYGLTCTRCSLRYICEKLEENGDKFCHLDNDFFVKEQ